MKRRRVWVALFCLAGASVLALGCAPAINAPQPEQSFSSLTQPLSGLAYQSDEVQALQHDSFANPGLLWVDQGRSRWQNIPVSEEKSCRSCHDSPESMRGVATRYPRYDEQSGQLVNLTQQVQRCRIQQQNQSPVDYESDELLSLTALLTYVSSGLPQNVNITGSAAEFFDQGQRYFYQRRGQMNLACHHCHDVNAGKMLRGERLSQGHGIGYPTYRLQWQTLGSLHRRLRFCNQAIRAEPFEYGAAEYVNLEMFLAWRAGQLPLESPAVRR